MKLFVNGWLVFIFVVMKMWCSGLECVLWYICIGLFFLWYWLVFKYRNLCYVYEVDIVVGEGLENWLRGLVWVFGVVIGVVFLSKIFFCYIVCFYLIVLV